MNVETIYLCFLGRNITFKSKILTNRW